MQGNPGIKVNYALMSQTAALTTKLLAFLTVNYAFSDNCLFFALSVVNKRANAAALIFKKQS
jgi:hypothetical protein